MSKIVDQPEQVEAEENEEILDPNSEDFSSTTQMAEEPEPREESTEPEESGEDVPPKFQGKSAAEIAKAYRELEQELGRKGNEIGELRKLTDQLLELEIQQKKAAQQGVEKQEKKLSDDDFFDSPSKATEKYLQESDLAQKVRTLEERLASRDREEAHRAFVEKHPDFQDMANEEGFREFVQGSKYRSELAQKADQFDYEAANELFDLYKTIRQAQGGQQESNQMSDEEKQEKQNQSRKRATLESGSRSGTGTRKVFRRADLMRLKMNDPARYEAMQDEIFRAYAEGRVK